jgi:UDP-N-acetylglucosamine--N-acetylmuramyl-(pentapeptide) pyrophosphoryl-undecaprenol N-acetylglucosamine transferase
MVTDTRGDVFCNDVPISCKTVINTVRFSYGKLPKIIIEFLCIFWNFFRSWKSSPPDVIIGFGGLFTLIPTFVAKILGAKVIIYEQNSIVGKANRWLGKIANMRLSFFKINEKWQVVASPVRKKFFQVRDLRSKQHESDDRLSKKPLRIIVIGGSQGAMSFSRIIPCALSLIDYNLRKNIEIVQQVDTENAADLALKYKKLGVKASLMSFIHNIANEMASSQLAICRAGASTIAELSALGLPAILIPYPFASENHQFYNAMYYKNKKAAWLVEEKENIEQELSAIIINILSDRELIKQASSNMINILASEATNVFIKIMEQVTNEKISY